MQWVYITAEKPQALGNQASHNELQANLFDLSSSGPRIIYSEQLNFKKKQKTKTCLCSRQKCYLYLPRKFTALLKNWSRVDLQCWVSFRGTAKVIQLYIFCQFFSTISYHKILNIVPSMCVCGGGCCSVYQSFLILCNPMDCSLLYLWIFPARILEWVAINSSRGSSRPRGRTHISCIGRQILWSLSHLGNPIVPCAI